MHKTIKNILLNKQYNWLITGVASFIGSNLLEELLLLNQKVIGIDNYLSGSPNNIQEVLAKIPQNLTKNFSFYHADICSLKEILPYFDNIDFVLHNAACGDVPFSIKDPICTNNVNVTGFLNVLEAAKNYKIKRVVYASSSSVYGNSPEPVQKETQLCKPLSPYAVSKMTNEFYAAAFAKCYDLSSIGLRYFNVYGPRQNPSGSGSFVIPLWIKALIKNEQVFINGDGETVRDFCFIKDIVQANILAATTPNIVNDIYNIASGKQVTLNQLFETIKNELKISDSIKPFYGDFRKGDIRSSVADITKAKQMLNFKPLYDLHSGLKETIAWYLMQCK